MARDRLFWYNLTLRKDKDEMLKVENLKKNFGSFQAVKGVSFSVGKGEVLGFLGPNGAGKSTTMRMVTGFIPPSSGTAVICGHDILKDPVAAKSCRSEEHTSELQSR